MEFINALISLINPSVLMFLLVGVFLGSLIGTLPGLTATMGIALLVPLTFWLDSTSGFAMLIGLWNSAFFVCCERRTLFFIIFNQINCNFNRPNYRL